MESCTNRKQKRLSRPTYQKEEYFQYCLKKLRIIKCALSFKMTFAFITLLYISYTISLLDTPRVQYKSRGFLSLFLFIFHLEKKSPMLNVVSLFSPFLSFSVYFSLFFNLFHLISCNLLFS